MGCYREMYLLLFNAVTDAVALLADGEEEKVSRILCQAQQTCEELYMRGNAEEYVTEKDE